jgi:glycerate kinase
MAPARVLVAPDKFKGTLTAPEAAEAIARGWQRAVPDADVDLAPLADGGEGTLDTLLAALGGSRHRATVTGPLGNRVEAEYAEAGPPDAGDGPLGVVEMARASGLSLIHPDRRDPKRTTTRGTGELIRAVCGRGVRRVLVCIGGSATNDGGAGMAQGVGIRLLDRAGRELGPGGAALLELGRIDATTLDPAVARATFVVGSDVPNPLLGPNGASAVYGPQKGATPEDVALLDQALGHFAAVIHRDLGIDVRNVPGAGAAGGLGAGLIAFLGARMRPGIDVVMDAVHLAERLEAAGVVVTGEGMFDRQSLAGKVPGGVLRVARGTGVPVLVLCGQATETTTEARVVSLVDRFGEERAMQEAARALSDLAAEEASTFEGQRKEKADGEGG